MTKRKKKTLDIEQEAEMYTICFSILALCIVLLTFLSANIAQIQIPSASITGNIISDLRIFEDKPSAIDYDTLTLENISQELAFNAILQAESDMQEMQEQGFSITWVNDALIEAKSYFKGEDYTSLLEQIETINNTEKREKARILLAEAQEKIGIPVDYKTVLEKTQSINERKLRAYELRDNFKVSEMRIKEIEELRLNVSPLYSIFSEAETEFKDERYEEAESLLAEIGPLISKIKAENTVLKAIYKAGTETTFSFIKQYYKWLIALIIILSIITFIFYNRFMVKLLKDKVKETTIEKKVLEDLMVKAQSDYYSKGILPKHTYDVKVDKYKEGLMQIKHKLPVIQARLHKLSKLKRLI